MEKGGSHKKIFSGDIQIEDPHQFEILQILLRDEGNGDIGDVQFVFVDQMKEQVEGTFKHLQPDRIGRRLSLVSIILSHQCAL